MPAATYKPPNFGASDAFAGACAGGSAATAMATFNGTGQRHLAPVRPGRHGGHTGWLPGRTDADHHHGTTDATAPDTTITKKPKTGFKRTSKIKFTSNEAGVTFQCKVDSKKFKPRQPPLKLKNLRFGKHKIQVRAIDAAGNVDASPARAKR